VGTVNPREIAGLIEPEEGEWLAKTAGEVPGDLAIVECGSHRGLSACWIGTGSRAGAGALVTCVDTWPAFDAEHPYPLAPGVGWQEEGALEQFRANISAVGVDDLVTPVRSTAVEVAANWDGPPVGLFFHDADHAVTACARDYLAWLPHLAQGAWIAVHDYYGSVCVGGEWKRDGSEQTAVRDAILPSGEFTGVEIVGNLWVGRRS